MNLLELTSDQYFMNIALAQGRIAYREGEIPVGAVAVKDGEIIAKAYNQVEKLKDATAHAEMILLTKLPNIIGDWRFNEVTIYVTKEPCAMCAGAMVNSRIGKLVFGIYDNKYGAAGSAINVTEHKGNLHKVPAIGGVLEKECLKLFKSFFKILRAK
ncbi:MAG: tRNA adenosine(34) deaminase TadA [Victivallales bacterium]|nr:tRNA adenosine(34) deaminase TadA [Victivallales bacterium]